MGTLGRWIAAAALLTLFVGVGRQYFTFEREPAAPPSAPVADPGFEPGGGVAEGEQPAQEPDLESGRRVLRPDPEPEPRDSEVGARGSANGLLVDTHGRPLANVRVVARDRTRPAASYTATTRDNGTFELPPWPSPAYDLDSPDWMFVGWGLRAQRDGGASVLVAGSPRRVAGFVEDGAGIGVEGASVRLSFSLDTAADLPFRIFGVDGGAGQATWRETHTTSALGGRFVLERVPDVLRGALEAKHADDHRAFLDLDAGAWDDLRLRLHTPGSTGSKVVRGRVVEDDSGAPVPHALVTLGRQFAAADAEGRFELDVPPSDQSRTAVLAAAAPSAGWEPALLEAFWSLGYGEGDLVELRLRRSTRSISGRVVDASGAACVGWRVDVVSGVPLAAMSQWAESFAGSGAEGCVTDASGRFELFGLLQRAYSLRAWSEDALSVVGPPVPAGTRDVELRLPPDPLVAQVTGRVLTHAGEPLESLGIRVATPVYDDGSTTRFAYGASVISSTDGRFSLARVPRSGVHFQVTGPGLAAPQRLVVEPHELEAELVLTVEMSCALQVGDGPFDAFEVVDGEGRELDLKQPMGRGVAYWTRIKRRADGFPLVRVSDVAQELVLYRDGDVVRRVPLQLRYGSLNRVDS